MLYHELYSFCRQAIGKMPVLPIISQDEGHVVKSAAIAYLATVAAIG